MTHTTDNSRRLTVVDLDGTYLAANSLHIYLHTAFCYHIQRRSFLRGIKIGVLLVMRAMRLIPHSTMKFRALDAAGKSEELLHSFSTRAKSKINPVVTDIIGECIRNGEIVVLATAAPRFYLSRIWNGDIIATEFTPRNGLEYPVECRNEEKLYRVQDFMNKKGYKLVRVISDHHDDKPLFRFNTQNGGENILISPSKKTITRLAGIPYNIK